MYNDYMLEQLGKLKQQELQKEAETARLVRDALKNRKPRKAKPGAASSSRQLLYIFLAQLSILFVGMGVFPILPVYAGGFNASPARIGLYLALVYVSISIGTLLTGCCQADRLGAPKQRRPGERRPVR